MLGIINTCNHLDWRLEIGEVQKSVHISFLSTLYVDVIGGMDVSLFNTIHLQLATLFDLQIVMLQLCTK